MSPRFWIWAVLCSILPDLDIYSFFLGFPYEHFLGHRGFSHSLLFALLLSLGVVRFAFPDYRPFSTSWWKLWLFFFLLTGSHGLLDAMTDGGLGVAFFSPFNQTRHFLPWRPLRVSPIGLEAFFTPWGRDVILSEITWVWAPSLLVLGLIWGARILCARRFIDDRPKTTESCPAQGGGKSLLRPPLAKGNSEKIQFRKGKASLG